MVWLKLVRFKLFIPGLPADWIQVLGRIQILIFLKFLFLSKVVTFLRAVILSRITFLREIRTKREFLVLLNRSETVQKGPLVPCGRLLKTRNPSYDFFVLTKPTSRAKSSIAQKSSLWFWVFNKLSHDKN